MSFITDELIDFIHHNEQKDTYHIALQRGRYPSDFLSSALPALQAKQKLYKKIPEWAENPRVVIPDPTIVEQASSLETACYKASLIPPRATVLDLTGGMGCDTYACAKRGCRVIYLDPDAKRVEAARHNFDTLGLNAIEVYMGRAEERGVELAQEIRPDVLLIDPDRRPSSRSGRTYDLRESEPDLCSLLPTLSEVVPKAEVIIKLSPMMDITEAMRVLGDTCDVHSIGVRREAKELLLHYHCTRSSMPYMIRGVELLRDRCYVHALPYHADHGIQYSSVLIHERIGQYLYDLYPSIIKLMDSRFVPPMVWKPALLTHLYFSDAPQLSFPGRGFRVIDAGTWSKRQISTLLKDPINLVAKNFPQSTEVLSRQLHAKAGGDKYLFAYTDSERRRKYVVAEPLGNHIDELGCCLCQE